MGYNPADYAAVENEAKEMSKDELERDYVRKKDENYTSQASKIATGVMLLIVVLFIGALGYALALDDIEDNIQEVSDTVEEQVCKISRGIYVNVDLKGSTYDIIIDCSTYRFK